MSVRMALAKLAAVAAGGAILGGGAVHTAEAPSKAEIHHVKPIKIKQVKQAHATRIVRRAAPHATHHARRIVRTTITRSCQAPQQVAMAPVPYMAPMPPQGMAYGGSGGAPVVVEGGGGGGFGGGFFGGFFGGGGGGGGGNIVVSSTSTGSTSTS
eukprot:gene22257-27028_t